MRYFTLASGAHTTLRLSGFSTPSRVLFSLTVYTDVYVSSLCSYIEAVGGRLKIVAEFPEGGVAITNFSQVGEDEERVS